MDDNQHQREIVYCHQCENEWYRDEHGLVCPECQGDFVEVVEAGNDPRDDEQHIPSDTTPQPTHGDFYAPDPDEEDIDGLQWEQTGPDRYRIRGTYRTDIPLSRGQPVPQQGQAGGLMGLVGNMLQGVLGGQQVQQLQQQQQQQNQQRRQQQGGQQIPPWQQQQVTRPGTQDLNNLPRPASAPGSPPLQPPQQPGNNGTFVRHGQGPGFSYTIATTSNHNFGGAGNNLLPRNANGPQPFQPQPDHIEQMLAQMFANIGAAPGGPMGGGMRGAPGMHPFHGQEGMMGGPFIMGGPGGMQGLGPFANLFQLFGPPGGVAGDAVYSQEALDRIITQLMEQHQTGNAPGPATEAAIKSLPTRQISTSDLADSTGKAECSICMDEVPVGDNVTVLPCQHWFHADCIRAWLGEHDTCPHCRQGIMPKEGDASTAARPRQPHQEPLNDMRSPEFTRASPAGGYPFPRQGSGDGSQQHPFTVPESPTLERRNSSGGEQRRGSGGGTGSGVFGRMRDAFGGGSGSGGRG